MISNQQGVVTVDEQLKKLWDDLDKIREELAKMKADIGKIFVQIVGVDGRNGLSGRVRDLEEGRDEMESRLISSCKDCATTEMIKKHIEWHDKERSEVLTTKRFIIAQTIAILLYILSKIWKG